MQTPFYGGGVIAILPESPFPFLRLKNPLQPPTLIPAKLQQEFIFVASMSNMPYIPGKEAAISSWHFYRLR
jgi:hypothetical protein